MLIKSALARRAALPVLVGGRRGGADPPAAWPPPTPVSVPPSRSRASSSSTAWPYQPRRAGLTTSKIVMTVPNGFGIDSFAPPPPGWHMSVAQTGSGDSAVVTKVTWTGGRTPTGEDSLFQFLAQPASAKTYTFQVEQTYSDGSIVNWAGSESSAAPAPTIEAASSLGGGGVSVLTIIALVVGVLGLLVGGFALIGGSSR